MIEIELPTETQRQLARKAKAEGVSATDVTPRILERSLASEALDPVEEERLAAIDALWGICADSPISVDAFLKQKHDDTERER